MATAKKVSALTSLSAPSSDDLIYVVDDPAGTPTGKKATLKATIEANMVGNVAFANSVKTGYIITTVTTTPANATDVPVGYPVGSTWSDGSFIYVVTGASALKRVAIATW
jgi:hypothetical protein